MQSSLAMKVSPEEAAAALAEIERTRTTMRQAVRAHRGHYHLWIWGAAWIAMPLLAHFRGDDAARSFPLVCLAGAIASVVTGVTQTRQIRAKVNPRFFMMLVALVGFAAIFPFVLQVRAEVKSLYAYLSLVSMQGYVIAGLWTDTYLLWIGLLVSALLLVGIFVFPSLFWLWMAVFGGGTLVATGFYVRHSWH
jgi:hypothetical protein